MRRWFAGAAAGALLAAVPTTARAQESDDVSDSDHLVLVEQSPWVVPGGTFAMRIRVDDPPDDGALRVTLHDAVRNRSEFVRSLEGRGLRSALSGGRFTSDLDDLEPVDGAYMQRIVTGSITGEDVDVDLRDDDQGVYPVVVELLDGDGDVVDELVTHLVRLPDPDENEHPLDAVVVVPVHAPPSHVAPGEVDSATLAPLRVTVDALLAHPGAAVTLAPTPEALAAAVEADPTIAAKFAELAVGRDVLAEPWARLDPTAWRRSGLTDELGLQGSAGRATTSRILDVDPTADVAVIPDGGGTAAVATAVGAGAEVVLVPEQDLEPLDEDDFPLTLTRPFEIAVDDRAVDALMIDAGLAERADATGDPVLDAHRMLADLAFLGLDQPRAERAAVVVLDDEQAVNTAFLSALLDGLDQPERAGAAPLVRATSVRDVMANVDAAGEGGGVADGEEDPLVRSIDSDESVTPVPGLRDDLVQARASVSSFRSVFGDDDSAAAEADELILTAGASSLSANQREALLTSAIEPLRAVFAQIHGPQRQRVTLTARQGQVQFTLGNDTGRPARVVIELRGDRLEFPGHDNGQMQVELAEGANRIDLDVRARSSGDAPLDVRILSPDGRIELSPTVRITVRTTAFSGVGLVLMGSALLFLVVWWTRTILRERGSARRRHPAHAR